MRRRPPEPLQKGYGSLDAGPHYRNIVDVASNPCGLFCDSDE